jgi:hypothetical protein
MTTIKLMYLLLASVISGAVSGFVLRIFEVWLRNSRVKKLEKKLDKKYADEVRF